MPVATMNAVLVTSVRSTTARQSATGGPRVRHYSYVSHPRLLPIQEKLRYAVGADRSDVELDGFLNYHFITTPPDVDHPPRLMLEAGINLTTHTRAPGGDRRPLISLRSSPWKAGHVTNPWHDEFDLDHGHIRYYGDHKPTTIGLPGATTGNRALLDAWPLHAGTTVADRHHAAPLLVYRSVTVARGGRTLVKGHIECRRRFLQPRAIAASDSRRPGSCR